MSIVLTGLAVWLSAALVVGGLWALRGLYRRRREIEHERAVLEWRQLLRVLAARPKLPRQRHRHRDDRQNRGA